MKPNFVQKFMQLCKKSDERANMDKKKYLMQYDCIIGDEHKVWYIASRFSSLMEIDRITGEAKELLSLKEEGQYRTLIKDENRLLLFPAGQGHLWTYDIMARKTLSYPIPDMVFRKERNWSAKYIRLGNCVYFSWASPVIVRYDLSGGEWKVMTEWRKLLPKDCLYENWFQNEAFFYDGFLYFQIGTSQILLKLNPNRNEFNVLSLQISEMVKSIRNLTVSDGELWSECLNIDGTVSIYRCKDWNTLQCEKVYDFNKDTAGNGDIKLFSIMERIGDNLLLLPGSHDKAYLLNVQDRVVHRTDCFPTVPCDSLRPDWFSAFNYYKGLRLKGTFLTIHSWTHQLIEADIDGVEVRKIPITFSDEILDRVIKREFENNGTCNESEDLFDLGSFIHYVLSQ